MESCVAKDGLGNTGMGECFGKCVTECYWYRNLSV